MPVLKTGVGATPPWVRIPPPPPICGPRPCAPPIDQSRSELDRIIRLFGDHDREHIDLPRPACRPRPGSTYGPAATRVAFRAGRHWRARSAHDSVLSTPSAIRANRAAGRHCVSWRRRGGSGRRHGSAAASANASDSRNGDICLATATAARLSIDDPIRFCTFGFRKIPIWEVVATADVVVVIGEGAGLKNTFHWFAFAVGRRGLIQLLLWTFRDILGRTASKGN